MRRYRFRRIQRCSFFFFNHSVLPLLLVIYFSVKR
uniref:Uncharacterized protein n=1 Tax=Arundo donax TaxID=35708 RepID=A0A0A9G8B7_ARUDO